MMMAKASWGILEGNRPISEGKEKAVARVQIHIEKVHSIRHRLLHVVNLSVIYRTLCFMTFMLVPGALLGRFMDTAFRNGELLTASSEVDSFHNTF